MAATDGFILGALAVGIAFVVLAGKHSQAAAKDIEDQPIDADRIRQGVKEGWYIAQLTRIDDIPAVRLTGKLATGKDFADTYRLREKDFVALQKEGYPVIEIENE